MENQNPVNPTSFQESPKNNRRLILYVSILAISIIIAIGYFFVYKPSPNQNTQTHNLNSSSSTTPYCVANNCYPEIDLTQSVSETNSTLKTFSDSRFGFEFQYPKEWSIKGDEYILTHTNRVFLSYPKGVDEAVKSLPASYSSWDEESKLMEVGTKGLTVSLAIEVDKNKNPENLPIREWFNKEFDNGKDFSSIPTLNQDVKIAGVNAVKIAVSDMGTHVIYYIPRGTDIIRIIYTKSDKYDSIYNQIISSFKFVSTSTDTSTWKVFESDYAEFRQPDFPEPYGDHLVWDLTFANGDNFDTWTSKNKNLYAAASGYNPIYPQPESIKTFNIRNLRGEKRYFAGGRVELRITNEKRVLIVDIFNVNKINLDKETLLDGIIYTTKFLPTPTIDITNWKTYTNSKYSLSFKYPSDWVISESSDGVGVITLKSPDTKRIIEGTSGERSDEITIVPKLPLKDLAGNLPEPITFSEEYFLSEKVKSYLNEYIGKISISNKVAYQFRHSEFSDDKYTVIPNIDGSVFTIRQTLISTIDYSDPTKIEPYDSIISTLKIGN